MMNSIIEAMLRYNRTVLTLLIALLAPAHAGTLRYAEDQAHTFGVKKRANAHQYRDWVIQMFNEDLPFDKFINLKWLK